MVLAGKRNAKMLWYVPRKEPCLVLVQEHREALAPVLVSMLAAAGEACPPGAEAGLPGARVEGVPAAALAKEAVYAAAAAAAYDLHDYIDFGPWFRGALLQVPLLPGLHHALPAVVVLGGSSSSQVGCAADSSHRLAPLCPVLHHAVAASVVALKLLPAASWAVLIVCSGQVGSAMRSARRVQVTLCMLWGQELADEAPAARPLRRRAAMLVGAWAPKLALADRPAAYRALLGLLARQSLL